jgi:hypothetical protein
VRRPGRFPLLWGCLLAAGAAVLWGWAYGLPHTVSGCPSATCVARPYLAPLLLTLAGAFWIATGLVITIRGRDGIDRASHTVVDQSMTTVLFAFGATLAVLSAAIGWWLLPIGLTIAMVGVGGLIREQLELRRLRGRR